MCMKYSARDSIQERIHVISVDTIYHRVCTFSNWFAKVLEKQLKVVYSYY